MQKPSRQNIRRPGLATPPLTSTTRREGRRCIRGTKQPGDRRTKPYWKAALKEEKAQGGTGWNTQRDKRLFFQRSAVVIARANAHMIKSATAAATRIGRMGA